MNRKTFIQFAHLAKQIACFLPLMTSIVIPFIRLVAPEKGSELQQEGFLLKSDSAELIV